MEKVKLTDICDFQGGSQPPKEEWSFDEQEGYIRMLQIRDFTQGERVTPEYIKISNTTKMCEANDILIARYGASIGKILTGLAGAYNVAIMRTIPDTSRIKKLYLYYYLKSPYFQNAILNVGSRAAQAGFNKEDLSKLDIECPELIKQDKIIAVLEKLECIIEKRKIELSNLDDLIKARFVEVFGDININDKNWECEFLGNLCTIVRGGSPRPIEKFLGGDVPWIKIGDATEADNIYLSSTKEHIIKEGVKNSRLVKEGSLIFANCGVSLGFARIITFDGCIHDGWLAMEDIDKRLDKVFLLQALNQMTEHFRAIAPAGTQPNLNTAIMKAYKQVIPPIELQKEFIRFVHQVNKSKFDTMTFAPIYAIINLYLYTYFYQGRR